MSVYARLVDFFYYQDKFHIFLVKGVYYFALTQNRLYTQQNSIRPYPIKINIITLKYFKWQYLFVEKSCLLDFIFCFLDYS